MTYLGALQKTLAAEHAAVYVVAALGAQTSQTARPDLYVALTESYAEHRAARDRLVELIGSAGGDPVVARTAYALPADLDRVAVVEREAREVQRTLTATYALLVASSIGTDRRWPMRRLQSAAVREIVFGGVPEAFPGSDEYSER